MTPFRWLATTYAMLLASCGSPPIANPVAPDPEKASPGSDFKVSDSLPPQVLRDDTGIIVTLVHLEDASGESSEALVRLQGIPYPLTGLVLRARREFRNNIIVWYVEFDGLPTAFLSRRTDGQQTGTTLYLNQLQRSVELNYDASRSDKVAAQELISLHLEQASQGRLAAVARLDRPRLVKKMDRALAQATSSVQQACHSDKVPTARVPHEKLSDEQLAGNEDSCAALYRRLLSDACRRDPIARRSVLALAEVECLPSDSFRFRVAGGTLHLEAPQAMPRIVALQEMIRSSLSREELVLEDPLGKILIVNPDLPSDIYTGTESVVYRLRNASAHTSWAPLGSAKYDWTEDGLVADCVDASQEFKIIDDPRAGQILATVKRAPPIFPWRPQALARDKRGVYYYVDKAEGETREQYRVFVGQLGAARKTQLRDVAEDSRGMVLATPNGQLRLIINRGKVSEALWIEGKQETQLTPLDHLGNSELIYRKLGAYHGETLGYLCE